MFTCWKVSISRFKIINIINWGYSYIIIISIDFISLPYIYLFYYISNWFSNSSLVTLILAFIISFSIWNTNLLLWVVNKVLWYWVFDFEIKESGKDNFESEVDFIVKGKDLNSLPSTIYDADNKKVIRQGSVVIEN